MDCFECTIFEVAHFLYTEKKYDILLSFLLKYPRVVSQNERLVELQFFCEDELEPNKRNIIEYGRGFIKKHKGSPDIYKRLIKYSLIESKPHMAEEFLYKGIQAWKNHKEDFEKTLSDFSNTQKSLVK